MMMKSRSMALAKPAQRGSRVVPRGLAQETTPGSGAAYVRQLPGISDPFPQMFDPAGFSEKASIAEVRRWRESELVHGRVAMLAALGFVIGENLEDYPAFLNFDGHIQGPAIYQFQQVKQGFWEPLLITIGLAEAYRVSIGWATPTGSGFNAIKPDGEYQPGELGFDPLGLSPKDKDDRAYYDLQTKELNNGRLAMIAVAGFVAQELVNGKGIFEHLTNSAGSAVASPNV